MDLEGAWGGAISSETGHADTCLQPQVTHLRSPAGMQRGGLSQETKQQQTEVKSLPLTHPVRAGSWGYEGAGEKGCGPRRSC